MLRACIYPHRLSVARSLEAEFLVELNRTPVGGQHQLMEARVLLKEGLHHLSADAMSVTMRKDQHVGKVDNEVAIGNCIAETDELASDTRRDKGVRTPQRRQKLSRLFSG